MRIKLRILLSLATLTAFIAVPALGQVTKVGTTAAKFLSIPVGSRALGMGGAFVAVADDGSAMYWNPGGLAGATKSEAVFFHANWIADIAFNYGGVVFPLHDLGTVGINITSMATGEMERTTEDFPEGTGQTYTAGSMAVGLSYAKRLADWFYIGANVKYINEYIWNSSATGFAVDLGTLFFTPFPGIKFGAGISNFGTKMRITGDDLRVVKDISPNNGNNPNLSADLTTDPFDLPLTLRIGVSYEPIVSDEQHLTVAVDAAHPSDNSESVNIGAEYSLFGNAVVLRGGYRAYGAKDSEEKFTFGGGVLYEVTQGITTKFDYAYEQFGRLSNIHTFTIGILF